MLSVVFPLVFLMFPMTFVCLFPYVCSPVLLSDSFCYSSIHVKGHGPPAFISMKKFRAIKNGL